MEKGKGEGEKRMFFFFLCKMDKLEVRILNQFNNEDSICDLCTYAKNHVKKRVDDRADICVFDQMCNGLARD